ncbi:MAG TPA: sulfatase-like hydrolase/transferase, partial [Polyangiaceae bacterium]|nr:sulfatase-like hydrolase/transferase [Polyangiaceae bacterium]
MRGVLFRMLQGWAAALCAAVAIALLDAALALREGGAALLPAAAASYSLLSGVSFFVAPAVSILSWSYSGLAVQIKGVSNSVLWPCRAAAFVIGVVLLARVSLWALLLTAAPAVIGAIMAVLALALTALLAVAANLAAGQLAGLPALKELTPRQGLLLASLIATVIPALLIATGQTSGAGGALAMFGVLRRAELDLRAPTVLLAWLAFAWFLADKIEIRRVGVLAGVVGLGLLGSALGYRAWTDDVTLALRRAAPLTGTVLGPVWRLSDRDHDGASALFGGGDCDDHNASRYPGAVDQPGNGVDEDCSGSDDPAVALEAAAGAGLKPAPATTVRDKLPAKLNVVLITIDTLRHDLGYLGYQRPVSPNLDELVKKSVLFERAYSLASYTGKSLGPSLIGKYPGETARNFGHFDKYSTDNVFIQERAQKAGIRTVSVQAHWYMKENTGLGRGFDVLDLSAAPKVPQAEGDRSVTSDKLTDAAIAQLQTLQGDGKQFYLWVHYLDPHAEYVPHEEFNFGRNQRALYDGEVAFTDKHIGRLLQFLEGSSLAPNTALIVTSDHGEAFGEHGLIRHGFELWEELIRVPLIVHVPGIAPRRESVRRSNIDLVPTLLDLLGIPKPEAGAPDALSGQSLLPDLLLPAGQHAAVRPVFADLCAGPYNDERQALIEDDKKLITAMGRPAGLYDLSSDEAEKNNLLSNTALLATMKAQMAQF